MAGFFNVVLIACASVSKTALVLGKPQHILFIASDDMRPEMSPYGLNYMKTPNFQSLADDGFTFRRSYVQYALCGPSRTALLTGRRPDTSRVWDIGPYFRKTTGENWTSLPQFFKNHGYRAIGHGKIFHEGNASGFPLDQDQEYGAWTVPYYHPSMPYNHWNTTNPDPCPIDKQGKKCPYGPRSNGPINQPWQTFDDGKSALEAIKWIKNASAYEKPFFLAVGFHKPHFPYIYPKEFEYEGDVEFPPKDYYITQGVPPMAPHDWTGEGNHAADLNSLRPSIIAHDYVNNKSSLCDAVPYWKQREMKRSYYSCVQYIDHLVGQLVGALKEEGLYEQTTIIFWGDHGYKLGEHCDWFKHDNYEDATRIPVIVKPSGSLEAMAPAGQMIEQLVEEVDIFPSLIDLAGLPAQEGLEGLSWVPLLQNTSTQGKARVFWQYSHGGQGARVKSGPDNFMGYTIRTPEWRYTEWAQFYCSGANPMSTCAASASVEPRWNQVYGRELYDHRDDASIGFGTENENLVEKPEYASIVADLHKQLVEYWKRAADSTDQLLV